MNAYGSMSFRVTRTKYNLQPNRAQALNPPSRPRLSPVPEPLPCILESGERLRLPAPPHRSVRKCNKVGEKWPTYLRISRLLSTKQPEKSAKSGPELARATVQIPPSFPEDQPAS